MIRACQKSLSSLRRKLWFCCLVCAGFPLLMYAKEIPPRPAGMVFTKHCVGRFEFELPEEMQLLTSGYGQPQFFINIYHQDDKAEKKGVITGEHRLEQWLAYVGVA
ncbi:hypothetical protein [Shewanella algae]|uniref:hypothetical protein n=1 Tax=Shewanella algae TaxID=38313 RepID=UPI0031F5D1DB